MKNAFGPWGTSMNDHVRPQLSTFWKRRLAMLSTMSSGRAVFTRRTGWLLAVAGVAICALPTLWYSHAWADEALLKEYHKTAQAVTALLMQPGEPAPGEPGDEPDRDRKLQELERKLEALLQEVRGLRASEGQRQGRQQSFSQVFRQPEGLEMSTFGDRVEVRAEGFVARAIRVRFDQSNGAFIFEGQGSNLAEVWRGRGNPPDVCRGQRIFYWPKDDRIRVEAATAITVPEIVVTVRTGSDAKPEEAVKLIDQVRATKGAVVSVKANKEPGAAWSAEIQAAEQTQYDSVTRVVKALQDAGVRAIAFTAKKPDSR